MGARASHTHVFNADRYNEGSRDQIRRDIPIEEQRSSILAEIDRQLPHIGDYLGAWGRRNAQNFGRTDDLPELPKALLFGFDFLPDPKALGTGEYQGILTEINERLADHAATLPIKPIISYVAQSPADTIKSVEEQEAHKRGETDGTSCLDPELPGGGTSPQPMIIAIDFTYSDPAHQNAYEHSLSRFMRSMESLLGTPGPANGS